MALQYRKKPIEIEAIQLTNESIIEVINWTTDYISIKIDTDKDSNVEELLFLHQKNESFYWRLYNNKEPFGKKDNSIHVSQIFTEQTYELVEQ